MKKTIILGITLLLTTSLLVGCNSNTEKRATNSKSRNDYNPFNVSNENVNNDEIGFEHGLVDPVNEISYTGIPIVRNYYYNNVGNVDCKLGFMIFVDGIPQKYKVNKASNEETMHEFSVAKKSKMQFKFSLNPQVIAKGNKQGVYMVTILNPQYMPTAKSPEFGYNHELSQVVPVTLKNIASANIVEYKINHKYSTKAITDEIKKEYLNTDKNDKTKYNLNNEAIFKLKYKGDYKNQKIEINKASDLELTLEGLCGSEDIKYRTTIFIDNKPVKTTAGEEYLEIGLKKGMLSNQNIDVDIRGLIGNHILSTISVPIGNDYTKKTAAVEETRAILLSIKE